MSTPTLKELIAQATPGPWAVSSSVMVIAPKDARPTPAIFTALDIDGSISFVEAAANAKLAARLSPEVAGAVYEALDGQAVACNRLLIRGDVPSDLCFHLRTMSQKLDNALRLLDGMEDAK